MVGVPRSHGLHGFEAPLAFHPPDELRESWQRARDLGRNLQPSHEERRAQNVQGILGR